ncbi:MULTISPECIES: DUF123 domain-containing protein [Acidiplasma]|jgi:Uri superfamily endonuclease|uniref:GIY-YIG domain-containing protein n=2 Tax=Acidiplasma TaxID=507753 RepID=A0A0Q0RKD8_9ARCH|nr:MULTISPECIES: GIY-YIG nuclease family protein [Acidiplasma]KPV47333.1 hypothetical protein SE19_01495 [Acidiplasma aeolicum]KQB33438.1 hypothetical protein AOG54_07040 [Acidiplasma aeolicum]KQB35922.1 hypothetical protein AOG55_05360 [Acidiplasma cupricumulans]WMT55448.1 MAG: GIY-YIG nuclease family protein [Acidiplasma sp.]
MQKIPGVYALGINVIPGNYRIGAIGEYHISGNYFYVGSAINGLYQRVCRHLNKNKKKHWHIDYLNFDVRIIVAARTENHQKESEICNYIKSDYIKNFGSTDTGNKSHLFYCSINEVENAFKMAGLKFYVIDPDCGSLSLALKKMQ